MKEKLWGESGREMTLVPFRVELAFVAVLCSHLEGRQRSLSDHLRPSASLRELSPSRYLPDLVPTSHRRSSLSLADLRSSHASSLLPSHSNFSLIFPFINEMIVEETGVRVEDVGFYSGLVEGIFAFVQFSAVCQPQFFFSVLPIRSLADAL